jgi:hypothetical protein
MKPKPTIQNECALRYGRPEAGDLRTGAQKQREASSKEEPKARHSPRPMSPALLEHIAADGGLDLDDARTHKILTQMFTESRNTEAAESSHSSHSSHKSVDHDLVDLLEDDERILGNIKAMKEAEYPKLLDIAAIIWGFEQCKTVLENGSSEEAVLQEIGGDASPTW